VFIDETATKTNMMQMWGRSPSGVRLIDTTPHGHWRTSNFIAGLRVDGLVAPCVFDGAINGELFRSHVEQVLMPTLTKDDVVAMDNLACHKVVGVREAIEAAGATIRYLPACSPDLNPIEMVFANIEAPLRAKAVRTVDALWKALGTMTDCITPTEARNFFRHAGYFQSGRRCF
jgi:transposase